MDMEQIKTILQGGPLKKLLDSLEEGISLVDRDCRILFYNKTLANLEGLKQEEVLGRSLFDVLPSLSPASSTLHAVMATGEAIEERYQQYFNSDGREIRTINSTFPVYEGDHIAGAFEIARDVSLVVTLTEKVAALERQFSQKRRSSRQGTPRFTFEDIIGSSPWLRRLKELLSKVSHTTSTVLLYGETGTGKELFAQSLHNGGSRRHKPFLAQNCAALPETLLESILFGVTKGSFTGAADKQGLLEQANGGTVFLDEINSMSLALQAKLLRVLQDGSVRRLGGSRDTPVDVRFIAATNEKPVDLVRSGKLREDLFYRLSVICVEIPPLRERREDIAELTGYFIKKYNARFNKKVSGVSDQVAAIFLRYAWPGNVRELEHTVEALLNFIDAGEIRLEHLQFLNFGAFRSFIGRETPPDRPAETRLSIQMDRDAYEKKRIEEILAAAGGNIAEAARRMGIKRQSLQYRLKKYGIGGKPPQ